MIQANNLKPIVRLLYRKTRNFLLSQTNKEFLVFLFFVFVSFCFWLLQTLDGEFTSEVKIPIRFKNLPEGVILTTDLPKNVTLSVNDRGTVLMNYMFGKNFYPVHIDFDEYRNRNTEVHIPVSAIQPLFAAQLNQSTEILSYSPDTISYAYTTGQGKRLPVRLGERVKLDKLYFMDDVKFNPDSVIVYAPTYILDTLRAAYVTPRPILSDIDTLISQHLAVNEVKNVRFSPTEVNADFYIDIYTEKSVEVPIVGINFPPDKILRTFPSKANVTFKVGLRHFQHVNAEDFFIGVTYEELLDKKDNVFKLNLKSFPAHVTNVRIQSPNVEYVIEQRTLLND